MSTQTETFDPPTDAVGTAAVAPAGPVPQPRPSAAIAIPDGDPAAGALALLAAVQPDAGGVLGSVEGTMLTLPIDPSFLA